MNGASLNPVRLDCSESQPRCIQLLWSPVERLERTSTAKAFSGLCSPRYLPSSSAMPARSPSDTIPPNLAKGYGLSYPNRIIHPIPILGALAHRFSIIQKRYVADYTLSWLKRNLAPI
jgi:hypothetical protein